MDMPWREVVHSSEVQNVSTILENEHLGPWRVSVLCREVGCFYCVLSEGPLSEVSLKYYQDWFGQESEAVTFSVWRTTGYMRPSHQLYNEIANVTLFSIILSLCLILINN